ncbi:hypothetical protein WH47_12562 [Habropoda laboriosa]|uniref:DUF5641 domain-containing protein n=1 Tax=Habropoda laboriosa TaxID=597456 RepID=A0A0L7QKV7_9HYME|nr:hypothetical protein WH47_12562 [Habropoda laboriosa]
MCPLTPGHFLIGGPLTALPEPSLEDVPTSRLSRWQLVQQKVQHFWTRWRQEYLHQLQTRSKWTTSKPPLKVGDLCLVTSETTPPSRWPLARVLHVHPGPDNQVRVVTLRTSTNTMKRPVTKLVLLPQHPSDDPH